VRGVTCLVDQPQKHGKQSKNDDKEKHGEEPHLFLVKGRVVFAPIIFPEKHAAAYCKPAPSANWF